MDAAVQSVLEKLNGSKQVVQELKDSEQVVSEPKDRRRRYLNMAEQSVWDPSQNESGIAALPFFLGRLFDKFDRDRDGLLSDEEGARFLREFNTSGEDVTPEEIDWMWRDVKKRADANEDGQVSRDELIDHVLTDPCREDEDVITTCCAPSAFARFCLCSRLSTTRRAFRVC